MKRVGIVTKLNKPKAEAIKQDIIKWLDSKGIEVFVDTEPGKGYKTILNNIDKIELMIVLGGDGTILYAARLLNGRKIPILGINLGSLGFLTEVTVDEIYPVLENVIKGKFEIEERMMLSVNIRRQDSSVSSHTILNDVAIKGMTARLINLETRINKEYVTTYRADGLIIATPTGSTGYSLSAGGPILYPTIHSIIVSPICPFTLTNRPVVIPDWMTVEVNITGHNANVLMTLDGQKDIQIQDEDTIEVKKADCRAYIIKSPAKSYFDVLRTRLQWGE
ncbi:MAG: NAD(+)/NADH kinase [Deltaproteobacteria bacterium]|nr:NAD(+)/NADH kinase [Deltaproteobacteria bacterium]